MGARTYIILTLLLTTVLATLTHIQVQGGRNDIVLLTAPVWEVKVNLTGRELVEHLKPTSYNPSPRIYTEDNVVVLDNVYHVVLDVKVNRYWVIVAKLEILDVYTGKPPRTGVGGYQVECSTTLCPRAGYWISVVNIYPRLIVYQLQGHYSKEKGRWLFSEGVNYPVNKTVYTLFFARLGEYVVGGVYGESATVYYYIDNVVAPILTAYGVKTRVYWVAVLEPGNGSMKIVDYVPETKRTGFILKHTGYRILLVEPNIVYKKVFTTTVTRVIVTTSTMTKIVTETYTKPISSTLLETETTTVTVTKTVTVHHDVDEGKPSIDLYTPSLLAGVTVIILSLFLLLKNKV